MQRTMIRVAALLAVGASAAIAQGGQPPRAAGPPAQPGQVRVIRRDSARVGPRAGQMREHMQQMMKEHLGLTDAQVAKLEETHKKFAEQNRLLAGQARDIRMAMRDEMLRPDSARSAQLSALLDKQSALARQRLEIAEAHQKELATFLTPLQRVKLGAGMAMMRERMRGGPGMGRGFMGARGMHRQGMWRGRMGMMGGGMGPGAGMGRGGMEPMMGGGRMGGMMGQPGMMGGRMGQGGGMGGMQMGPPPAARRGPPPTIADSTKKKPEN
ncbi:MAG: hypothetical protein HYR75_09640 [Gemmatimonadetes bacterium]|nr:hypothetical protein [Gemmatimonadota bacterium]MBI3569026.1 hypothetical protein [Gemmatimonadota bacterium]